MPSKKSSSKKTTTKKTAAKDVKPLPSMGKKDSEGKKLPALGKNPAIPPNGDKETNDVPLKDQPVNSTPDRESLEKSLREMSGNGSSSAAAGLAEEFMPLLAEKVDTLGHRLDAKFDEFSAALTKLTEKETTAVCKEVKAVRKEVDGLRTVLTSEVLPILTRMEGVVAALHKQGGVTVTQVAEAQEEIEEAVTEDLEDAEGEAEISPGLQGAFDFYLNLTDLKGQVFPVETFAELVLDQASQDPDTEIDPDTDTVESGAKYLKDQGLVTKGMLTIK